MMSVGGGAVPGLVWLHERARCGDALTMDGFIWAAGILGACFIASMFIGWWLSR